MDKLLKIGTTIFAILAVAACLSTVCIVGYAIAGGKLDKSPEEVYQAEIQAHNEETQDIHVLTEITPVSLESPTPLYNEHIHNYTDSVDVKANCYQEGRLKYTCDTCEDVYYIDMPMTGHRPDDEWTVTRETASDLVGLRVKYCIYCDQIVAIEDIPYTSKENSVNNENHVHNYMSTIEKEPTCMLAGLRKYTCSCGDFYTEPIHASGHVASDWEVAAEATSTHKGTEQIMCRVCGVLLDSRPIDAKRESPNSTESPANTATSTITPTNTPMPTSIPTQRPIATPSPVNTPRPTATPTVRPTARPTNTPTATPTPTPPIQSINYSIGEMIFYTYDDNSYYRFIQPITNTGNVPLYLKGCTLDIEDKNGHLLSSESFISNCPDVIAPGETGYFYNGLGSLSTNDAVKNASSIVAVPKLEIVESDEEPITYRIFDTSFTQGNFSPSVVGRITNNTREDDSLVYVQVIFYGENGNVIYITGTNIMNLLAGQTQSFEILILPTPDENILYENIANYEVIARKAHYQF